VATERELAAIRGKLFGLIDEDKIRMVEIDRPSHDVVTGFLALTDLSSSVSDALDALGVGGSIGGSVLVPRLANTRIVGPAITIRYVPAEGSIGALVARGERARLAERDLYNIGQPGDVAVFDCGGHAQASVMGGLSAAWARRTGMAGCVVDGATRDLDSIRAEGVPVWSRAVTPTSGKHRLVAAELNGEVAVAGAPVRPGDLIVADETGVCVVPGSHAVTVLDRCREAEAAERSVVEAIRDGVAPEEVARALAPERW
jgi:4-hydroxy-4-methyl-2-oxoglutarate aldolase